MSDMLTVMDHPLIRHKITLLRDINTKPVVFRMLVREIAQLMLYEATRDLALDSYTIETPLTATTERSLAKPYPVLVSIMRAGNAMLDGALDIMPMAAVSHIGIFLDHDTLEAHESYFYAPTDIADRLNIIVDPMLATANSAIAAVARLKDKGVRDLRLMSIITAPEGLSAFVAAHADVPVFAGVVDDHLNDKGYIIPGLGDAGDRAFNTA